MPRGSTFATRRSHILVRRVSSDSSATPPAPARTLLLCTVLFLLGLLFVEQTTELRLLAMRVGTPVTEDDFTPYWQAASNVAAGTTPYDWLAANRPLFFQVYVYPPLLALLLAPATLWLDYQTARIGWLLLNGAALGTGIVLLYRTTTPPGPRPNWLFLLSCLVMLPTTTWALNLGQATPLLFLLLAASMASIHAAPRTAGALLAAAAWLKTFPVLAAAFFLLRRRWAACCGALVMASALLVLSLAVLGWETQWTYIARVLPAQSLWVGFPSNISLPGLITRLFIPSPFDGPFSLPVVSSDAAATLAFIVSYAVLLVVSAYAIWHASSVAGESAAYALAIVTALLLSPITGNYSLVIALVPLAVAVECVRACWPRHIGWLLLTLLLLSLPVFPFSLWPVQAALHRYLPSLLEGLPLSQLGWGNLLAAGPVFGLLALWALLVRLTVHSVVAPGLTTLSWYGMEEPSRPARRPLV